MPNIGPKPIAAGLKAVLQGSSQTIFTNTLTQCHEPRWFVCRFKRFPGEGAVRVVVSHEDITAMKLVERQQMRSQRLESLGTLAGGVAHDLNNSLAPILMGMGILQDQYPEENKLIGMIHNSAKRGADMVRQLLAFAKGVDGKRIALQPTQLVTELESLMKGSFQRTSNCKWSAKTRCLWSWATPRSCTRFCSTCVSTRAMPCPTAANSPWRPRRLTLTEVRRRSAKPNRGAMCASAFPTLARAFHPTSSTASSTPSSPPRAKTKARGWAVYRAGHHQRATEVLCRCTPHGQRLHLRRLPACLAGASDGLVATESHAALTRAVARPFFLWTTNPCCGKSGQP